MDQEARPRAYLCRPPTWLQLQTLPSDATDGFTDPILNGALRMRPVYHERVYDVQTSNTSKSSFKDQGDSGRLILWAHRGRYPEPRGATENPWRAGVNAAENLEGPRPPERSSGGHQRRSSEEERIASLGARDRLRLRQAFSSAIAWRRNCARAWRDFSGAAGWGERRGTRMQSKLACTFTSTEPDTERVIGKKCNEGHQGLRHRVYMHAQRCMPSTVGSDLGRN
jgi:hypothetical protein